MRAPARRRLAGLLVVVLMGWLCVPTALAGDRATPATSRGGPWLDPGATEVPHRLTLDTITASELTFGRSAHSQDLGDWRSGRTLTMLPPLRTRVTRSVPDLWRLRLSKLDAGQALSVQYEVFGADGSRGRLTNLDHPEAELGVVVEAIPPQVIHRDEDGVVVEGGMVLQVAIGEARFAGTYSGFVMVTVTSP